MNRNLNAHHNRNTRSGHSYVYASYVVNNTAGYVAVIDPANDEIIKRISTGRNPAAMCLSPSGDKLYVMDDIGNIVFLYNTDTFNLLREIPVGNKPAAIIVESSGKLAFVANYGEPSVTAIDIITNWVGTLNLSYAMPFAIASNENSSYVYMACKGVHPITDSFLTFDINNMGASVPSIGSDLDRVYDPTHNPLTVHPNGHTLVELGNVGFLDFLDPADPHHSYTQKTSLLDNTVSGVYLDNGLLFCTMREERDFLKVFKNLDIDANGNITYDGFKEIPSYKGQDKIRTSPTQKYIGVTIQPYDSPLGGLQIIDVDSLSSKLVELNIVGDLAFASDSKAYVGELNSVRPIDLTTATVLPAIDIAGNNDIVMKVISGYSNQSL